ncbi:LLM class F420-dependent oxidoreductase [Novosphingobium sp. JCM 18896]|uniref:LLM class F420-dependent oxidoreductase n=1 Tax=Novosphingobium sp. JCM 18896 TaxID=2989731 RepID=UPI002221C4A4|nr:LLM class F420-dependent oxidoreductase [Novosphingobium sp. JCM 18896]MCW1431145.1 LLM class F420-dependent oxidoreductase [Novosphingobium sp. JCM 18896]
MTFTLSVTLPFDHIQYGDEFVSMAAVHECAKAAEDAGFWSGTVTDHPVPSYRWLDNGGHYAQDPFVMLSMVAAVTTKLRLQTNIVVLPYRNPFITARSVSSLDAFSNGRVILGLGAGYLKPEYKALGVDFDSRNDLMDEYMKAMKLAWTGEDFSFEGTGYTAVGNRVLPKPVQNPHPPLLVGGNSKRALRRTVELGDAWHPFIVPKMVTDTARTANIEGDDDIIEAIEYMKAHCEKVGRATPPPVIASSTFQIKPGFNAQEAIDHYAHMKSIGVDGSGASVLASTRAEWCDLARQFGEEVISKVD